MQFLPVISIARGHHHHSFSVLPQGDAAHLPFDDNTFDTIVDTFSLCVFSNPLGVLRELQRVLKPDGVLLMVEHTRSTSPLLAVYQVLSYVYLASEPAFFLPTCIVLQKK